MSEFILELPIYHASTAQKIFKLCDKILQGIAKTILDVQLNTKTFGNFVKSLRPQNWKNQQRFAKF